MLGIFESMKNDKNRISQNYFAHSKIFSFIICIAYKKDCDLVDNTTTHVFFFTYFNVCFHAYFKCGCEKDKECPEG